MTILRATILVEPTGKGRARSTYIPGKDGKKGFVSTYTPAATRKSEAQIIADIRHQLEQVENSIIFGPGVPLRLTATFYRARPKSLPKRVQYPVSRPDLDNYQKLLSDALNHFVYAEDSQIIDLDIHKRFAEPGKMPRIELEIGGLR